MLASNSSNLAWNNSTTLQTFWQQHYKRIIIVAVLIVAGLFIYKKHVERQAQQAEQAERNSPAFFPRLASTGAAKRARGSLATSSQYIYVPSPTMVPIRTKPRREAIVFGTGETTASSPPDHPVNQEHELEGDVQDADSGPAQAIIDTSPVGTSKHVVAPVHNDPQMSIENASVAVPLPSLEAPISSTNVLEVAQPLLEFAAYEEPAYGVLF